MKSPRHTSPQVATRRFTSPPKLCIATATLLLALLLPPQTTRAAAPAPVTATLVALDETIQPGRPVTLALKLEHAPRWHTYWLNPGTGYPTSLAWTLPDGWHAGEIQWPVPKLIKDPQGNITGNGYDATVYLPVTLTPPPGLAATPAAQVTFRAKAEWLMCNDSCMPGSADLALTLPILPTPPQPTPLREKILAAPPMPETPASTRIAATRLPGTKTLTLTISPAPSGKNDAHFFSNAGLIPYDKPQTGAAGNNLELTLPISDSHDGDGKRLTGVLAFTDAKGIYRGLSIDVEINDPNAATSNAPLRSGSSPIENSTPSVSLLLLAFAGGLILNLMPCVFPVLGIKILGFVNQAGSSRRKVTLHGIAFTAGVLISFWILAALLAALRAGGNQLGWGFQLQSPPFVFVLAALLLVFALSMSGVFEIGLAATSLGAGLQEKTGCAGSFFTGILATIVATPCAAPFLAPALGAALALPAAQSFLLFTLIALGLSTPYLLLSIFPNAMKILPRPGPWMETLKQLLAFLLYATVAFLIWVLAAQLNDTALLATLLALVLIAMSAWIYGRYTPPRNTPARRRLGATAALLLLLLAAWLGWPRPPAPTDITWEKWSPAAVATAQAAGKTIYVDFTARWCATCQANKTAVFSSPEVRRLIHDKNILTLKADWTNADPQITAELARYNRSAVPFNLVYKPDNPAPRILPELLTPRIVLDALK